MFSTLCRATFLQGFIYFPKMGVDIEVLMPGKGSAFPRVRILQKVPNWESGFVGRIIPRYVFTIFLFTFLDQNGSRHWSYNARKRNYFSQNRKQSYLPLHFDFEKWQKGGFFKGPRQAIWVQCWPRWSDCWMGWGTHQNVSWGTSKIDDFCCKFLFSYILLPVYFPAGLVES